MSSFRKIVGAVSEINSLHPYIRTSIHPHKVDLLIEPVAFAGSILFNFAYIAFLKASMSEKLACIRLTYMGYSRGGGRTINLPLGGENFSTVIGTI